VPAQASPVSLTEAVRPLQQTAAEFRQECQALDHLSETLLAETEQLRQELEQRARELEEGRRRLAERGRQLAEQRKETGRLTHLLEQQDSHLSEALSQLKGLREQIDRERDEARQREEQQVTSLDQRLREAEAQRDEFRHQLQVLQATAGASGVGSGDSLAPLLAELSDIRRQSAETHAHLADTRAQVSEAIERTAAAAAAAAAQAASAPQSSGDGTPLSGEGHARLSELERERPELEAELELVRTRAAELQETVNTQRRELTEQRAEFASELRLLRELVEQNADRFSRAPEEPGELVCAGSGGRGQVESEDTPADPVISSVMAQFARLQKDVAQRRKKK
jgi:DNA repair exonuclease SbcCD ATPase subunit